MYEWQTKTATTALVPTAKVVRWKKVEKSARAERFTAPRSWYVVGSNVLLYLAA